MVSINLNGKAAIVTGAAGGLGKAIALKLRGRFQEADAAYEKAKAFGYKANPSSALSRPP